MQKLPVSKLKSLVIGLLVVAAFVLYRMSDLSGIDLATLEAEGSKPWQAALIIGAMAGAWAFALPASVFFFITPLLFMPLTSAGIITAGSVLGGLSGYVASRTVGGPWIERFKEHRVTRFLSRHSNFFTLFAIRVVPSSPHGFINYGAGLVEVPLLRFLLATALATAIKGFVYASAVRSAMTATSLADVIRWETVIPLFALALLALAGRWVHVTWFGQSEGKLRESSGSAPVAARESPSSPSRQSGAGSDRDASPSGR